MVDIRTGPDITLEALVESWARHMRAANLSPRTIYGYTLGARLFLEFAVERGMPTGPAAIRREHVEAFIEHVLARRKPSTAATYYKNLQQLFKWLAEEGEIPESPMVRMRAPKLDEQPVPVIRDEYLQALLDGWAGRASTTAGTRRSFGSS
jgi:site-specific recombinase XerD